MDPRLNPNLTPRPRPTMNDIRPSQPTAQVPPAAPVATVAQPVPVPTTTAPPKPVTGTQVVESIPMKIQAAPIAPAAGPNIPTQATPPPTQTQPPRLTNQPPEDELDKILQAVNNRVGVPIQPASNSKTKAVAKTAAKHAAKAKEKVKIPKSLFGMAGAVALVAIILIGVAIFAYKQGQQANVAAKGSSQVGTSYKSSAAIQQAGGSLVRPGDLDDFSNELQTRLNGLNDSQDFDTNSLSDAVLGL